MTTSNEATDPMIAEDLSLGPPIPDFQNDAEILAAYTQARDSFESRAASEAEERIRTTFAKRRLAIRTELDAIGSILYERKVTAEKALWEYANRYPLRVHDDIPTSPSLWEWLWSFGMAGRLYQHAVVTAAESAQAQSRRRRLERDEEELEQQLQRALYLQEDARKRNLEGPDALTAFHAQPAMAAMRARVEEIEGERALYAARLEAGEVSPSERRDRDFAQHKILPLEAPFDGATIIRVARYDSLAYCILRDLEGKLYRLAYDPRLEPLIEQVIDVYWLVDCFNARLTVGPIGWPMSIAEHYATNFKNEDTARTEYRKARVALSLPRTDIPPMHFPLSLGGQSAEEALIELLASFAQTIPPSVPAEEPIDAESDATPESPPA